MWDEEVWIMTMHACVWVCGGILCMRGSSASATVNIVDISGKLS